jgi:hypothetical protein
MTMGDVMDMLPFDERRGLLVATTEITRSYAQGQMMAGLALQEQWPGVRVVKRWYTNADDLVCEICGPLDGQAVDLDEMFDGAGEPPAHPGCRCWMETSTEIGNG